MHKTDRMTILRFSISEYSKVNIMGDDHGKKIATMCSRFRNGEYRVTLNLLEGVKTVPAEIDPRTSSAYILRVLKKSAS